MSDAKRPSMFTAEDWNDRYRSGDLPWDSGKPSPELVSAVEGGFARRGRAIDLGCGTGTNSIYLAEQGFTVTGVDISDLAIDRARQKAQAAAVRVDFFATDLALLPAGEAYDFVFDRGCYHCVRSKNIAGYRATLERLTHADSTILILAGNAAEQETEQGPPRVTEDEIRAELGDPFTLEWLRTFRFEVPFVASGEGPLAWSIALRRRDA